MAFFGVTKERIDKIWPHPKADRLELGSLVGLGFQFVLPRDRYHVGDEVLYIPIDSILTQDLKDKLGLKMPSMRVKTIKLRDQLSQGIVADLSLIPSPNMSTEEITTHLGVTKYDPPPIISTDGILLPLPDGQEVYDIEGADRYSHILELLMEQEVYISEKMEGTNFSCNREAESKIFVNQRQNSIQEKEGKENVYWRTARNTGLIDFLKNLDWCPGWEDICKKTPFVLYGELCGPKIQGNYYKLPDHKIFLFDMKVEHRYIKSGEFFHRLSGTPFDIVPLLFHGILRDFLNGRTVQEASNGMSLINPSVMREGIVIKPAEEQFHPEIHRLVLKQRSPVYLAGTEN